MKNSVIIRLQVEGIHQWVDCSLPDVLFLKHPHRHIFYIECKKHVSHLDRDIEIITLKREVEEYLRKAYGSPCNFGGCSCEMIATELIERFKLSSCQVLEDNENGALIEL